ncbi:hypothetical protein CFSAN001627_13083 [Clostridium botulinum CFSAN001627]|uniref:Uncharacterized protein n=1 Tax=Clostridium botulinum CFSAN001627 TaxID=1232189 RepID=M1ZQ49_CLOBO|nr:hypothetical protein CFSAN001627_13083 [Clostridium botulinum CFSAN001627]
MCYILYCTKELISYPSNLSFPFRSVSSITKLTLTTSPPNSSTNFTTEAIVPPVARRSSTMATLSPFFIESLCI